MRGWRRPHRSTVGYQPRAQTRYNPLTNKADEDEGHNETPCGLQCIDHECRVSLN